MWPAPCGHMPFGVEAFMGVERSCCTCTIAVAVALSVSLSPAWCVPGGSNLLLLLACVCDAVACVCDACCAHSRMLCLKAGCGGSFVVLCCLPPQLWVQHTVSEPALVIAAFCCWCQQGACCGARPRRVVFWYDTRTGMHAQAHTRSTVDMRLSRCGVRPKYRATWP